MDLRRDDRMDRQGVAIEVAQRDGEHALTEARNLRLVTIFTATIETVRLSGLAADIDEPADCVRDRIRLRNTPEVVVGSVPAATEDGRLLTAPPGGSQLAPYE